MLNFEVIMDVLKQAIMTHFATGSPGIYDDLGGRLRHLRGRQGETFPFATYAIIGYGPDYYFDQERIEEITVQFNIYANESSAANIDGYKNNLLTLFDECALNVTGFTFLRCERSWAYPLRDEANNVHEWVVQYRITLEKVT